MPSNILSKSIFCTFFIFILSGCGEISAEISSLHNYQNAHNNDLPIGDSAITPPHMLVLKSPIYSTSIVSNIIITVDGVEPGDKVYLYDDAACFLSRGSAVASAKTIDILHDPIINIGIYTIYARRTNNSGKSSGCSSSFVVYEKTNDLLGSLDLKFNTSGFVTKSGVYPGADIAGSNIIFTENGDLLLPGMIRQHANCSFNCYDGIIQKINLEGKYDLNFGTNGVMTYHRTSYDYINYLHFQKETSLIISVGSSDVSGDNPTLTAFNLSGILATSFGSTSGYTQTNFGPETRVTAFKYEKSENKFYSVCHQDGANLFTILKYLASGLVDNSFGPSGVGMKTFNDYGSPMFYDIISDVTGNFFLFGTGIPGGHVDADGIVLKLDSNGNFQTDFNGSGKLELDVPVDVNLKNNSIVKGFILEDNSLLVVGNTQNNLNELYIFVAKILSSGVLDTSFGTNGYFLISNGTAKTAVLDPDNNNHLYIGGSSQGVTLDAIIWKINLMTSSLSGDFGVGGKFTHHNAAGGNGDDEIQALAFHPTIRRLIALGRSQVGPSNFDIVTWLIK